jgi:pimeloyl-ACP methyl ester carboxylesterase
MTPLGGHHLERPDSTIRYWSEGTGGTTVVFLHGATLDHHSWAPQTDALRDRYRVVAPDLRGHGASTGRFDFEAAVEDVLALLEQLPAQQVVLVGLSLGANIAQEVIRRRPDRVLALVAADTTCNTAARHPLAASFTVAAVQSQAALAGDGFALQAARATATKPEVQQYLMDVNAHRTNAETVDILTSLLTSALRPEPDYRLPVPALLVRGQEDYVGEIATTMRGWAEREPLARYAVIPHAGHTSNLDNPEHFTRLLTEFLDEVVRPAGIIESPDLGTTESVEAQAEELYRRYGARPWHLIPEATRAHFRGLVAAGTDGQGQLLLRAAS